LGYFDPRAFAGFFFAVRVDQMLFAILVKRYLLGEAAPPTARDAWLADPARLPARMLVDYLRLVLANSLAPGRRQVEGAAVRLSGLPLPLFAIGAERDAIAPWRALYRSSLAASADAAFVLAAGDHLTGVVSPPGQPGAAYRLVDRSLQTPPVDPDAWAAATTPSEASWWPEWARWLGRYSSPDRRPPPAPGIRLGAAPGTYVLET
jgi:polyhydroxyalkanoate synthase